MLKSRWETEDHKHFRIRWREICASTKTIGMGAFFDSIHARTEDIAAVQRALEQVSAQCDAKFLMGPASNGWISILPSGPGPGESLSLEIAKSLGCDVFHLGVHDDDIFYYFFYRNGKLIDQYNSCPEYFNDGTDEDIEECQGRPELFQDLLPGASSLTELKELLAAERLGFESERMSEFADLFRISNALTRYDYVPGGEWEEFVHIECQPQSANDYNKRGEARLAKKDLDGALADFNKALGLDPNFAAAQENCRRVESARNDRKINIGEMYNRVGLQHRKMGELDEALIHFNKALEINPDNAAAYNNRGLTKKEKGNRDGALADLNKAIELEPDLGSAYLNRAGVKRDHGNFDEALADYDRAIELEPKSAKAYSKRGEVKRKKGDTDGALADFNKAIELNPKLSTAYVNRARIKRENGNFDEALADCDKAIELKPGSPTIYNIRGELKRRKGDADGALADYSHAIELKSDSDSAVYYCNRSMAWRMKRDLDGAMADCDRAIELKPDLALAYNNRGMIKKDKGDLDGAISDVEKAIDLESKTEGFRKNLEKLKQIKQGKA
ncbi:MAG TPA: tetratricopeptide repeat protein [Alphaproteobacteria bacterium]|nr:tetratricopeptide repeat protein [Alphaproteobacteria bacterium]